MASKYQLKKYKKANQAKAATSARICPDCGFRIRGSVEAHEDSEHHRVKKANRRSLDKNGQPQEHVFGA
jgi:hypothetical protein